jgi:cation diffusion facilitator family transporter
MAVGEKANSMPSEETAAEHETRLIKKVAFFAFLINLGLALMKGILAIISGSLAVSAGAIDSATDSIASLVLYGGVRLSSKKSPHFPLGLYKIENVISVVVAFFIFFAGYEIARQILTAAQRPPEVSMTVIVLLFVGTVATFLFGQYALRTGKRTGSPTLFAEARHRQVDVISSLVVLASAGMSYFRVQISVLGISIDQIAAGLVLIFIARAGWGLLADGMRVLLDASVDFETLDRVQKIIQDEPMVSEIKSLVGRSAGRFTFLQIDVVLRTDDLNKAHQVTEDIERNVHQEVPHVARVIIHYEPKKPDHIHIAVPLSDPGGSVSDHLGQSPYFALITIRLSDKQIVKQEVRENPHRFVKTAKGIQVAEWLVTQKIDEVVINEDLSHKGPGYVFSNAGVSIRIVSKRHLHDVIESILSDEQPG